MNHQNKEINEGIYIYIYHNPHVDISDGSLLKNTKSKFLINQNLSKYRKILNYYTKLIEQKWKPQIFSSPLGENVSNTGKNFVEMPPVPSLSTKINPFLSDEHLPAGSIVTTGRKMSKTISEK
jgi:hypothetical protein